MMQNIIFSPVAVPDLVDMIASEVQSRLNLNPSRSEEKLISRKSANEMLDVDSTTLWRWEKRGYLTPKRIGGKVFYKYSDLRNLMMGGSNDGK